MRSDRWQTGECGVYAYALMAADPALRFGAVLGEGQHVPGRALHFFAHDDTHAYDSRGAHPLPYREVWDSAFRRYFTPQDARCVTDLNPADFGELTGYQALALPDARRHIRRHRILQNREDSTMEITDRDPALYEQDPAPVPEYAHPEPDEDPRDYIWYSDHYLKAAA
jgi:hypothetical protein